MWKFWSFCTLFRFKKLMCPGLSGLSWLLLSILGYPLSHTQWFELDIQMSKSNVPSSASDIGYATVEFAQSSRYRIYLSPRSSSPMSRISHNVQMLIFCSYRPQPTVLDYRRTFLIDAAYPLFVTCLILKIGHSTQRCNVLLGFTTFKRSLRCTNTTRIHPSAQAAPSNPRRFNGRTGTAPQTLQDPPTRGRLRQG